MSEEETTLTQESDDKALEELRQKLDQAGGQGVAVRMSRAELGLLHKMITAPEEWRKEQVFLLCDFFDEEEALDHIAAYYEAYDLGMDTGFNIAFMFALAACNRKSMKTNRVSSLLDSLSHVKYTSNVPKDYKTDKNLQRSSPTDN